MREILLGVLLIFLIAFPAKAQGPAAAWSLLELVVQAEGSAPVGSMALVADAMGYLHWFYAHTPDESVAAGIDYVWWNGETWSEPVNIVVNRDGSGASNVRAAIDAEQNIHLVWGGGMNALYYATVPVRDAASPRAWSIPGSLASAIGDSDIIVGPDNIVYVVYTDSGSYVITMITSNNGGLTWETPTSIAASSTGSIARDVRIAVDMTGRQHVVWSEVQLPEGWPPTGIYYTHSVDRGMTWTSRLQIAGFGYSQISVSTAGNDEVHVVYPSSTALPNSSDKGIFHQWSMDGGLTWSVPDRFAGQNGLAGNPSFAVDSAQQVHYVIGQAFYASWRNGMLESYVDVTDPALRSGLNQAPGWTAPERAVIAITSGNRLHVVFETGFQELWHTTALLDVPEVPAPTLTPTATPSPEPSPTPIAPEQALQVTPIPEFSTAPGSQDASVTTIAPFIGTGIVALLIATLVITKARRLR